MEEEGGAGPSSAKRRRIEDDEESVDFNHGMHSPHSSEGEPPEPVSEFEIGYLDQRRSAYVHDGPWVPAANVLGENGVSYAAGNGVVLNFPHHVFYPRPKSLADVCISTKQGKALAMLNSFVDSWAADRTILNGRHLPDMENKLKEEEGARLPGFFTFMADNGERHNMFSHAIEVLRSDDGRAIGCRKWLITHDDARVNARAIANQIKESRQRHDGPARGKKKMCSAADMVRKAQEAEMDRTYPLRLHFNLRCVEDVKEAYINAGLAVEESHCSDWIIDSELGGPPHPLSSGNVLDPLHAFSSNRRDGPLAAGLDLEDADRPQICSAQLEIENYVQVNPHNAKQARFAPKKAVVDNIFILCPDDRFDPTLTPLPFSSCCEGDGYETMKAAFHDLVRVGAVHSTLVSAEEANDCGVHSTRVKQAFVEFLHRECSEDGGKNDMSAWDKALAIRELYPDRLLYKPYHLREQVSSSNIEKDGGLRINSIDAREDYRKMFLAIDSLSEKHEEACRSGTLSCSKEETARIKAARIKYSMQLTQEMVETQKGRLPRLLVKRLLEGEKELSLLTTSLRMKVASPVCFAHHLSYMVGEEFHRSAFAELAKLDMQLIEDLGMEAMDPGIWGEIIHHCFAPVIRTPAINPTLILQGDQGVGKSAMVEYYRDLMVDGAVVGAATKTERAGKNGMNPNNGGIVIYDELPKVMTSKASEDERKDFKQCSTSGEVHHSRTVPVEPEMAAALAATGSVVGKNGGFADAEITTPHGEVMIMLSNNELITKTERGSWDDAAAVYKRTNPLVVSRIDTNSKASPEVRVRGRKMAPQWKVKDLCCRSEEYKRRVSLFRVLDYLTCIAAIASDIIPALAIDDEYINAELRAMDIEAENMTNLEKPDVREQEKRIKMVKERTIRAGVFSVLFGPQSKLYPLLFQDGDVEGDPLPFSWSHLVPAIEVAIVPPTEIIVYGWGQYARTRLVCEMDATIVALGKSCNLDVDALTSFPYHKNGDATPAHRTTVRQSRENFCETRPDIEDDEVHETATNLAARRMEHLNRMADPRAASMSAALSWVECSTFFPIDHIMLTRKSVQYGRDLTDVDRVMPQRLKCPIIQGACGAHDLGRLMSSNAKPLGAFQEDSIRKALISEIMEAMPKSLGLPVSCFTDLATLLSMKQCRRAATESSSIKWFKSLPARPEAATPGNLVTHSLRERERDGVTSEEFRQLCNDSAFQISNTIFGDGSQEYILENVVKTGTTALPDSKHKVTNLSYCIAFLQFFVSLRQEARLSLLSAYKPPRPDSKIPQCFGLSLYENQQEAGSRPAVACYQTLAYPDGLPEGIELTLLYRVLLLIGKLVAEPRGKARMRQRCILPFAPLSTSIPLCCIEYVPPLHRSPVEEACLDKYTNRCAETLVARGLWFLPDEYDTFDANTRCDVAISSVGTGCQRVVAHASGGESRQRSEAPARTAVAQVTRSDNTRMGEAKKAMLASLLNRLND